MHRSWNSWCSLRRMLFAGAMGACGVLTYLMWFGMNSDRDNVPPLLTQLIPAGHCTCQSSTSFQCSDCLTCLASPPSTEPERLSTWSFQYGRDDQDLGLSKSQCQASFPGLFQDIHRGVEYWRSRGGISIDDLSATPFEDGMARAIISNGELYVVATKAKGDDHRRKILATLGSIYRALSASSDRTSHPTIEFIFSIEDRVDDVHAVGHPVWVLSRRVSEESVFLMPDFGYWSWAKSNIGPYGQVVERVMAAESELRFADKQQKIVWRGKLSFAPKLRRALLDIARGEPWSDVKELDWSQKANFLTMEDHCRYMFIGHVEGRAYSASLKYRQACRSVVVAHKLQYIQHHHYLLVSSGPEQNYVEVERDFSDLPKRMDELLKNLEKAERIADNNVKTFRERYLTQAAEACYWRALWEGWAEVSSNVTREVERPAVERGLRAVLSCTFKGKIFPGNTLSIEIDHLGFSITHIVRDNPKTLTVYFGGVKGRAVGENYISLKLDATQFPQPALALMVILRFEDMRDKYVALAAMGNIFTVEEVSVLVFYHGLKMQNAVKSDANGATDYSILLELVDYNVANMQYICAGDLRGLATLSALMNAIAAGSLSTSCVEEMQNFIQKTLTHLESAKQPLVLQRSRATMPLNVNVPFHSSLLRPGVDSFRYLLQRHISEAMLDPRGLIGKYTPTLSPILLSSPRSISKAFWI
ncbi:uncharacterized protein CDV56_102424 [Aspergillus thermomutatus]|uniref:fatty-acyl-CoA synthase system n=1 Tax=Aspergillus thermomutatus TaxID=41047 RepID=A0A397GU85_ASPTH|nr:uncharacterized protein CDV56_102424 [Aspergillus thermomutatus]RHZ52986.1 hypothetical protein CDV56_102424 [Aspergillus thermomutatus]